MGSQLAELRRALLVDGQFEHKESVMNTSLFTRIPGLAATTFALVFAGSAAFAAGGAVQRPLSDFLDAQGTYCIDDGGGGCLHFIDNDPNFLGWTSFRDETSLYFAGVDYAGLVTGAYAPDQQPRITGTVTERPLKDGTAEVTVNLHTKGANTWVMVYDLTDVVTDQLNDNPTLFGQRPDDAAYGQALADLHLRAVFTIDHPGAPLPDLMEINGTPALKTIAMSSTSFGPLTAEFGVAEGTPGRATIVETGLLRLAGKNNGKAAADGFPVEMINLQVVGH